MIRGLYTAGSGMMTQMARQDALANNLANVNTSGYKGQRAVSRAFSNMLISRIAATQPKQLSESEKVKAEFIGGLGTGVTIDKIYSDLSMGNISRTDNDYDLALNSDGYFCVQTEKGERYTRCGQFKLNNDGILTTSQGYAVLDISNRPINSSGELVVDNQGNIIINGETITRIKVVGFENLQLLKREGDSLLASAEPGDILEMPGILQGYIEESNVNAVKEMVELINISRAYETMQKVIQAEDETTQAAIEQVASTV